MSPKQIISEATQIPLKLAIPLVSGILALGCVYWADKSAQAASVADLDKRVALVERAVVSLEEMARTQRTATKP